MSVFYKVNYLGQKESTESSGRFKLKLHKVFWRSGGGGAHLGTREHVQSTKDLGWNRRDLTLDTAPVEVEHVSTERAIELTQDITHAGDGGVTLSWVRKG